MARYHLVHKAPAEPITTNCSLPVSFKIGEKGSEPEPLEELPPSLPQLKPSDATANRDQIVEVRYWLRLLIAPAEEPSASTDPKQPPRSWWATHPIVLKRTPKAGTMPGV